MISNLNKLIYLDSNYISSVYQQVTSDSPNTIFSNTQGKKGDIDDAFFYSDLQSIEAKSFTKSSIEMLGIVGDHLLSHSSFVPEKFKNYQGTQTAWFKGQFTMGLWTHTENVGKENEKSQSHPMYEVTDTDFTYALLAQPQLFMSNIGSLISASPAITRYIGIPVQVYGRVLYFLEDANRFVTSPYLIAEPDCFS